MSLADILERGKGVMSFSVFTRWLKKGAHIRCTCAESRRACRMLTLRGETMSLAGDAIFHPNFAALTQLTSLSADIACCRLHTIPSYSSLKQLFLVVFKTGNMVPTTLTANLPSLTNLSIENDKEWPLPVRSYYCLTTFCFWARLSGEFCSMTQY